MIRVFRIGTSGFRPMDAGVHRLDRRSGSSKNRKGMTCLMITDGHRVNPCRLTGGEVGSRRTLSKDRK